MSFRAFAGLARQKAAARTVTSEITQVRNLVVLKRWRDDDGQFHQELFEARCYADFAQPEDGKQFLGEQVLSNQDFVVRGLDLINHSLSDFIETSAGFWLDGQIVAGQCEGGIACDLLTYRERYLTLTLYLRKKPEER